MKKIAVLGAGLVGSLMSKELAADGRFEVTAYDRSEEALGALAGVPRLRTVRADLASAGEIARAAGAADVVVGAVPGFLGHAMLKTVIEAKRPVADISFAPGGPARATTLSQAERRPGDRRLRRLAGPLESRRRAGRVALRRPPNRSGSSSAASPFRAG